MNAMYIGLIAFLATAVPVLLGCYAFRPRHVATVKEREHQSKSRFDIDKIQDSTPIEAIAMGVLQTRRWTTRHERFYGFDSPPGRF